MDQQLWPQNRPQLRRSADIRSGYRKRQRREYLWQIHSATVWRVWFHADLP